MVLHEPAPIGAAPLRLEERTEPVPRPGELRLRVTACAVCRTDLQLCEGDLAARRVPIVPGHQAVGVIDAVGAGVEGWTVGERAGLAWLGLACEECRHCRAGRENLCERAQFTGWDRDGGYAEWLVCDARFALRLPEGFDDVAAAPLLCGGVIGYRSLRLSGIEAGGRLGLFGFGASASLAIQVAVARGCEVYVATRSRSEQARARALGARWAGDYDEPLPVALDAAVTFAPSGDVVLAALRAVDRGGTVAINAIHLDRVPEFAYEQLWWERQLRSVANFTRADATEFLALAAAIPLRTTFDEYPLAHANQALQALREGRVSAAAVLRTNE